MTAVRRHLVELGPAAVVALVLLPFIISTGSPWPWRPAMIDLDAYRAAARAVVTGGDVYTVLSPGWNLPFIYPPIAALLLVPTMLVPLWVLQLGWTALSLLAQRSVFWRCGVARGWPLGVAGALGLLAVEPLRTSLGYGQVNTLLMACVVIALLPVTRVESRVRGALVGFATAIKLTPGLFAVMTALRGRWRETLRAALTWLVLTLVAALALPRASWRFYTELVVGDPRTPSTPIYAGNQSLMGLTHRLVSESGWATAATLGVCGVLALAGAWAAARVWEVSPVLAVGVCGLVTCLVSPLAWTHHHVWVVPFALGLRAGAEALPRWLVWCGALWSAWIALCPPLALLPYGFRVEATYDPFQEVIANAGPAMGLVFVVGLVVTMLRGRARRRPTSADES